MKTLKILYYIFVILFVCEFEIKGFDIKLYNPDNPLKEGVTTKFIKSGAIGYSFREEDEIKKLFELENYTSKKRRKTQDGRICAKAFVSEQRTYFDCTMANTPDGEIAENEWCYVDPSYNDSRKWDFCIPNLDYDRIRGANFQTLKDVTKLFSNLYVELEKNISPAQNSIEDIKKIKSRQTTLENKINTLSKTISKIMDNLNKLEKAGDQCNEQEKKVSDLLFKIERKEKELKFIEQREEKDFSLAFKTTNCNNMLLYEDDEEGDGLIGYFYDNENFQGNYKEQRAESIEFDWTDGEPLPGINPNNFSIRWEGWILIPITDKYKFSVECDDGAELYLDNELIISHNTYSLVESFKNYLNNVENSSFSEEKGIVEKVDPNKSTSNEIYLIGNIKLKIVLKYFHSIHTSVNTQGGVFLKLYWQSKDFKEVIIIKRYLFTSFNVNPLKITNFDAEEGQLRKLHENETAFNNSDKYILQDIPVEFLNSKFLKLKTRYQKDYLLLFTNGPTSLYLAILSHYPNPLPSDFENTGMSMSLLELDGIQNKGSKKLIAKKSGRLVIYKKNYNKGQIQIKFSKFGLNTKGIPMVAFFTFDNSLQAPMICTGREILISATTATNFKRCTSSSDKFGYKCEDGFSGKMRDEEGGMWAANSDGVGAWVAVFFKQKFKITKIEYLNRKNPSERNSEIEIEFSSGEIKTMFLKNDDNITKMTFDSVRAESVKFTIKKVYTTLNNGGAFNIYGIPCTIHNLYVEDDSEAKDNQLVINADNSNSYLIIPSLFVRDKINPISLSCFDSLTNSNKFDRIKITENKKITVLCPESCSLSEVPIYGDGLYTKDSAICKAAFHSKKIPSFGGFVTMIIKSGSSNYKSALKNGIKSEGKPASPISIIFEIFEEEDIIILKPGTKVDLKVVQPNQEYKWSGAIITKVIDTNNGKFLNLILDGENSNAIEIPYPNKERIHPCGQHVKYRDCNGSLRRIKTKLPYIIRFAPLGYEKAIEEGDRGYLYDNGQIYGTKGKSYGWSIDMTNKIRSRVNPSHPYLETFIEFPPSSSSKFCTKARPDQLCEPVSWKVKAGKGKFKVKVYVGDPSKDRIIDLKINRKYFFNHKLIPKNTLDYYEEILETTNEFFEVTADCLGDCNNSFSIINAIEISQEDTSDDSLMEKPEKLTTCGNAVKDGRCNKGPNVIHCLFDDPTNPSAKFCNGSMALVNIPVNYKCRDQIGQYKCVNKIYNDISECKLNCPKECEESKCIY